MTENLHDAYEEATRSMREISEAVRAASFQPPEVPRDLVSRLQAAEARTCGHGSNSRCDCYGEVT